MTFVIIKNRKFGIHPRPLFANFWGMSQTILLENSSNRQFWKFGYKLYRITQTVLLENSSKANHLVEKLNSHG